MRRKHRLTEKGFTLIEVLMAMLISGFILGGLYTSFQAQQESYFVNERVTETQQNLRAAMIALSGFTRMAGYDPDDSLGAMLTVALPHRFAFSFDDSGVLKTYTYGFHPANGDDNAAPFGVADTSSGVADLRRNDGAGNDPIASNIRAVGFAYAYEDGGTIVWAVDSDGDGDLDLDLDTDGNGRIDASDDTGGDNVIDGTAVASPVMINNARAVKVWILARSSLPDRDHTDGTTYVVGRNLVTPNDGYYHRLLETTINLRNM